MTRSDQIPISSRHSSQMLELLKEDKRLWDHFTRREEYDPPLLDRYHRFLYCFSQHRNILVPELSQRLVDHGLKIEYPGAHEFAVCLTHDIDHVRYSNLGLARRCAEALVTGRLAESVRIPFYNVSRNLNPQWNFEDIIKLEQKYGAKSSFYFLALEKSDADRYFAIEDFKDELAYIREAGCEVGLHGSHDAFDNPDALKSQKERLEDNLGAEVIGYRNHYLRFEVPTTWELLRRAGFNYDTTFGYTDCVGFRNGVCHPFNPYNLKSERFINILEIPLMIMDGTLKSHMRLSIEDSLLLSKSLIDTVARLNGAVSILWHNTELTGEQLELYESILAYCHSKNGWLTSGKQLYEWWQVSNPLQREIVTSDVSTEAMKD